MKALCIGALGVGILFGICAAWTQQISYQSFFPNLAGLLIGAAIIYFSETIASAFKKKPALAAMACVVLLLTTFLSPGVDGIHRWLSMSVINLNISFIVAPVLCFLILSLDEFLVVALMGLVAVIYLYQPDAGQGSALGSASVVLLFLKEKMEVKNRMSAIFIGLVCIVCPWFMEDRLEAVPQVELILRIAFAAKSVFVIGLILVVGTLFAPFLCVGIKSSDRTFRSLTISIVIYWFTCFVVTEFGSFPVPVIGAGAAAVLGWSLSYALILATKPSNRI